VQVLARERIPSATVSVALGEWTEGDDRRAVAAESAREVHAHKILTGGDTVLLPPDDGGASRGADAADLRLERLLRECAAARDPRAAGRVVESWLIAVSGRAGASVDEVKSRLIVSLAAVAASSGGRLRADGTADVASALVRMRPTRIAELLRAHERSYLQLWAERAIADLLLDDPAPMPSIIEQAERHIADHFRDSALTLTGVARALAVSPTHLSHLFRAERDTTFLTHLTSVRIRAARSLLAGSSTPVADIATEVGYSSTKQLWIRFRTAVGCSPLQFRAAARASRDRSGLHGREQPHVVDQRAESGDDRVHAVAVAEG
jgi:AraC-like DNA-binding protein